MIRYTGSRLWRGRRNAVDSAGPTDRLKSFQTAFRMQMAAPEVFGLSYETQATRDHVGSCARTLQIDCWRRGTDSAGAQCRTLRKLRSDTTDEPEPVHGPFSQVELAEKRAV